MREIGEKRGAKRIFVFMVHIWWRLDQKRAFGGWPVENVFDE